MLTAVLTQGRECLWRQCLPVRIPSQQTVFHHRVSSYAKPSSEMTNIASKRYTLESRVCCLMSKTQM